MSHPHDWDKALAMYARLERNEALEWNADTYDVCRRVARDVAIPDDEAERALNSPARAEALVRELRRRIFEGSRRLSRAFAESDLRKQAGDMLGARTVLESVLAVEPVPSYRQHVTTMLDYLDEPDD